MKNLRKLPAYSRCKFWCWRKCTFVAIPWLNSLWWTTVNLFCSKQTTWTFCWVLSVCIYHWCISRQWNKEFHSVLQERTWVTTPEFYYHVYWTWTLRHILQWTSEWSSLPYGIRTAQRVYWTMWSYCAR